MDGVSHSQLSICALWPPVDPLCGSAFLRWNWQSQHESPPLAHAPPTSSTSGAVSSVRSLHPCRQSGSRAGCPHPVRPRPTQILPSCSPQLFARLLPGRRWHAPLAGGTSPPPRPRPRPWPWPPPPQQPTLDSLRPQPWPQPSPRPRAHLSEPLPPPPPPPPSMPHARKPLPPHRPWRFRPPRRVPSPQPATPPLPPHEP
mmetsp:Transcript_30531/g.79264  ORF Transcript_30531/g.79264 Transcript_30531/m.79264 type:complete len:200 (+) Transcript_30531:217-816(+)